MTLFSRTTLTFLMIFNLVIHFSFEANAQESLEKVIEVEDVIGTSVPRLADEAGVETPLAKGDFVAPGDTVITDEGVSVDLRMSDGSLIRVTPNSSFTVFAIDESENESGARWMFGLFRGLVEAAVTKAKEIETGRASEEKEEIKIEVKTPSATLGVRGTKFSLAEEENEVFVETIEGEVLIGGEETDFSPGSFTSVKDNEYVDFKRNEGYPSQASKVSARTALANKIIAQRIKQAQELRAKRKLAVAQAWKRLSEAKKAELKQRSERSRRAIRKMRRSSTVPVSSEVRKRLKWRRSASTSVDIKRIRRGVDVRRPQFPLIEPQEKKEDKADPAKGNGGDGADSGQSSNNPRNSQNPGRQSSNDNGNTNNANNADNGDDGDGIPRTGAGRNTGDTAGENGNRGDNPRGMPQNDPGRNTGVVVPRPREDRAAKKGAGGKGGDSAQGSGNRRLERRRNTNQGGRPLVPRSRRGGVTQISPRTRKYRMTKDELAAVKAAEKEEEQRQRRLQRQRDRRSGKATVKSKSADDKTFKSKKPSDKAYTPKRSFDVIKTGR